MPAPRISLETRFWEKVTKHQEGCWEWTGAINGHGYGHIKIEGRMVPAHRVAYEFLVNPIPEGLDLDHLCRTRHCVRPTHLEPVTRRTNILRGKNFSAHYARQTHCKRGHEFTPENTYEWGTSRHCRTCRRERDRQSRLQRRR